MDDANFAGLERDLKRRLKGVRLVLEIGLDEATVSQVMAAVADLVPRLRTPVSTLERKRPAILAVYLVSVAIEHYDGSLWPHQPMRQMSGNDLGPAFERVLHELDLETFDDLGDDLGHRYLTRILGHGGIPKFSTRDYLRLVIDTLRRNPGARADDLVNLWRTQKTAFFGIDEPVRRFLLYGGPVALDFLDRTIDLVALSPTEAGASSVGAYGLPVHIVGAYAAWTFGTAGTAGARGAIRLPRPTVRFDPWSGSGPVAELPAVGSRFRNASWRIAAGQSARLLAASLLDLQQVPLAPAPTWEIEFDNGGERRTYAYEVLRDTAVVCFDPATGSYVPDTQPIALSDVWMLLPPDTTLVARDGQGAERTATVLAELPTPTGAWHGFVARHVSLADVRAIVIRSGATTTGSSDAWLRVIRPSDRPLLVGESVADVVAEGGERVFARPPALRLPSILGFGDERWAVRLVGDAIDVTVTVADLKRVDDTVELPFEDPDWTGTVDLTLRGPLGSDLRERFCVVPGLRVVVPDRVLMPRDARPTFVDVEVSPPATLSSDGAAAVRLPVGGGGTELPVEVATGRTSLSLRVQLPRLQWGLRLRDAAPTLRSEVVRADRDAIESGDAESLLVATHRAGVPLAVQLWADGLVQATAAVLSSGTGGRWAFALSEFREAVRLQEAPSLTLRLVVGGQSTAVAEITANVGATDFRAEPVDENPVQTTISFVEGRSLRDRVVRFWSLQRPWAGPVEVHLADGVDPVVEVSDEEVPPGEYRVQVAVDDGWTSARRPRAGSVSTADLFIGTQGRAFERQLHFDLRSDSDLLELAVVQQVEPDELLDDVPDDVAALAFDGVVVRLEDERNDASRVTRMLLRIASRNESAFVRRFARRVEDEALDPTAALRLFIHALAEGVLWTGLGHGQQSLRALWQVCPPMAAYLEIASSAAGQQDAGDRCEQHLGWRPGTPLGPRVGVAQNMLGMPAMQLSAVRLAMGLIPREVFSEDAWPVAMFDWLIAEKQDGQISGTWWRRYSWIVDSSFDQEIEAGIQPYLEARNAPDRHPDKWAAFPKAILAAAIHLVRADADRRSAAAALLAALDVGGRAIVVHDLCRARALVEPGEVAPDLARMASEAHEEVAAGIVPGDLRMGQVRKVIEDGAFVDIEAHVDAFLHRSEYLRDATGEMLEPVVGDLLVVLVTSMDERFGRLRVSARAAAARELLTRLGVGDRLIGRVTGHSDGGTFIDLGFLGSFLPLAHDPDHVALEREVGGELEVYVLGVDPEIALVRLTRKDARAITHLLSALVIGQRVDGTVTDVADFGVFVSVGPVEGLIRTSRLDRAPTTDAYEVGDHLEAEIIEIRPERGQLTLSRQFVVQATWDAAVTELSVGDIVDARVTSIAPFGVFMELSGVTGFVHRSELAWMHDSVPDDFVVGSRHPAKIIEIDPDRRRVNLSFKQLKIDPAIGLIEKLAIGDEVHGEVTNVLKFGAFVRLDTGLEGLIHYTELRQPVEPGTDEEGIRAQAAEGDSVVVRVLAIDREKRRVSLTLRRPHPWLDGPGLPAVGTRVTGSVLKVDDEGVRVIVPDRLIGIWRANGSGEAEGLALGSEIGLVVAGHDQAARRLELVAADAESVAR